MLDWFLNRSSVRITGILIYLLTFFFSFLYFCNYVVDNEMEMYPIYYELNPNDPNEISFYFQTNGFEGELRTFSHIMFNEPINTTNYDDFLHSNNYFDHVEVEMTRYSYCQTLEGSFEGRSQPPDIISDGELLKVTCNLEHEVLGIGVLIDFEYYDDNYTFVITTGLSNQETMDAYEFKSLDDWFEIHSTGFGYTRNDADFAVYPHENMSNYKYDINNYKYKG